MAKPKRDKMEERQLASLIAAKLGASDTEHGSNIGADRILALSYYRGEARGDEMDGRSQVVSRDVAEVVDTALPQLVRVFGSGKRAVAFQGFGEEDKQAAEEATDTVNHVWNVDNPGFMLWHDWFKDALLFRCGILKVWADKTERRLFEEYEGLSEAEALEIVANEDGETRTEIIPVSIEEAGKGEDGLPLYNMAIRRVTSDTRINIAVVPPEEFRIGTSDTALSPDTGYCAHRYRRTISDLRAMKYPEAKLELITDEQTLSTYDDNVERQRRMAPEHSRTTPEDDNALVDEATKEVWITESFLHVDFDGDGFAEYRKVTTAGNNQEIVLDNVEVDDNEFASLCPYPIPHKFYGESFFDKTRDIQDRKTALERQALDNLYLVNTPQRIAVPGQVNMDDLLSPRVNGIIRASRVDAVREVTVAPMYEHALKGLEYTDTVRENRTGITRYNQGLDANSLNKTATGINAIMSAANMRVELIARLFAETGVTRAFKLILKAMKRYQNKARTIRLRGKSVKVDPRSWNADMDVQVSVGLGTGNQDQKALHLGNFLGMLQAIVERQGGLNGPLVYANHVFNVFSEYTEALDLKGIDHYMADPSKPKPPPLPSMAEAAGPPPEPPEVIKAKTDAKIADEKAKQELAHNDARLAQDLKNSQIKAVNEAGVQKFKAQVDTQIKAATTINDLETADARGEFERAQAERQAEHGFSLKSRASDEELRTRGRAAGLAPKIDQLMAEHDAASAAAGAGEGMEPEGEDVDERIAQLLEQQGQAQQATGQAMVQTLQQLAQAMGQFGQAMQSMAEAINRGKRVVRVPGPDGQPMISHMEAM